jgi:hypothetical protein
MMMMSAISSPDFSASPPEDTLVTIGLIDGILRAGEGVVKVK